MSFLLNSPRTQPSGSYHTTNGTATVRRLDAYLPPFNPDDFTAAPDAVLAASFTPSGTTVTINPTADNAITFTNATAREYICLSGHSITGAYYFRAGARRKPGTTGAIAQQAVVFTVNSVEVGRFTIGAAAASTDPFCGHVELTSPILDARFDITTDHLIATFTEADSDIEVFFELLGAS